MNMQEPLSENTVNDNAGHGVRGLRPRPSAELFQALRDSYGINGLEDSRDLGGSSSLNLLITDCHIRYVVRVFRPYLTEARFADYQLARQALHANGVPVPEALHTLDGREHILLDGRVVELERYVEHDATMNSWEHLLTGLPLLGKIHTILKGIPFGTEGKNPLFANYIDPEKTLRLTAQGVQRMRSWNLNDDVLRLADDAEKLAHLVSEREREHIAMLPRQMVHGDYWDNNVLFHNGQIVLVNDFDFMGERARIDDLALTLYYFSCSDKPVTEELLGRLRSLIDAYEEGLGERLSMTERLALPLAMARQPLWSIGGWIALLDDEHAAQRHAQAMPVDVDWALRLMNDLGKWQTAFADNVR